jgi:TatD DNase family protein
MADLVDTHCHIQSAGAPIGERTTLEKWSKHPDRTVDAIVDSAIEKGVTKMICVGCDVPDSELAVETVRGRENLWASIGIHPHEAQRYVDDADAQKAFAALADREKVVAIGECGLDYYYEHSPKEAQLNMLRFQIELALEHDMPMIFHVRDAFDDFWPVFESYQGIRGVLHSFTDTQANLEIAMAKGLHIGVNGIATFSKDEKQREMYKNIPLSRLLLETDAPFLTPSPYRGTICEPYHTSVIAEFLSDLRGESPDELAQATTNNAINLFKLT